MIALYVQTVVLLAIAYFLGAALAYVIRRSLYKPAVQMPGVERRVDPLPEFAGSAGMRAQAGAVPPVAQPKPAPTPAPATGPAQDLRNIRLIDETTEAVLKRHGVNRYEQIAAWTQGDIARLGPAVGGKGRIAKENWIEQAQVLAKGGETDYARRRARGEIATAIPSSDSTSVAPALAVRPQPSTGGAAAVVAEIITAQMPPPAAPAPAPAPAAVVPANVAERAAFSVEAARVAVPIRPEAPAAHDNLLRIGHVDADIAKALNAQGVLRYAHIAQWSPADIERLDKQLGTSGRIARENWVEQAQILSRGGDTAFSRQYDRQRGAAPSQPLRPAKLADAIRDNSARDQGSGVAAAQEARRPGDIGALRSVRSGAFQGEGAGETVRAGARLRPNATEDLKRIRGIGVLIEKKLNSMGITSYETIANWSAADIDRVSQTLDFKGRIERENWIEQARILASGGATEFSRRVDRGEVETSRART